MTSEFEKDVRSSLKADDLVKWLRETGHFDLTFVRTWEQVYDALPQGPVVATLPWQERMDMPDAIGYVWPSATGELTPETLVVVGFDPQREAYRLQRSRGIGWGQLGRCWLASAMADQFVRPVEGWALARRA